MSYSGTPNDVQSITFANGMTMNKVVSGNGLPISIDASGLHFQNGCYLSYTPSQVVSFDAASAFARLTVADLTDPDTGASISGQWQYPISMTGNGETFLGLYARGVNQDRLVSDLGFYRLYLANGVDDIPINSPFVVGAHFDMHHAEENEGPFTVWRDGKILGGRLNVEPIMPTEWAIGKGFNGTIHEGVTFVRVHSAGGALYPPGVDVPWICEQLAA